MPKRHILRLHWAVLPSNIRLGCNRLTVLDTLDYDIAVLNINEKAGAV
jgi:hypothetical protein